MTAEVVDTSAPPFMETLPMGGSVSMKKSGSFEMMVPMFPAESVPCQDQRALRALASGGIVMVPVQVWLSPESGTV